MKEKIFENKIKSELKKRGAYVIKYWGGGRFTKSGVPDILTCYKGKFLGLEIKAENGKPSELQKYNIELIRKAQGIGLILYPKDYDKFINLLNRIDEEVENANILFKDWML